MYGVPADLDLSAFVGCTLDQICLGMHVISFSFTPADPRAAQTRSITVEGHWELRDSSGALLDAALADHELPLDRKLYRVHQALGRTVLGYEIRAPQSIILKLSEGLTLTVSDDSDGYESIHVMPGDHHI
jgi:hypothetical protein